MKKKENLSDSLLPSSLASSESFVSLGTQYLRLRPARFALGLRSNSTVGMTGLDSVIHGAASASAWDGNASHYPTLHRIDAKSSKLVSYAEGLAAGISLRLAPVAA